MTFGSTLLLGMDERAARLEGLGRKSDKTGAGGAAQSVVGEFFPDKFQRTAEGSDEVQP